MKFFETQNVFQFSWDQVLASFWKRYPNPYSKHVLSDDVVERKIVGNQLLTKRLICKTNSIPRWGESFVKGCRHVYVIEESIVDPVRQTVVTYTRNISLKRYMMVVEKCVYKRTEDLQSAVACERYGWIGSSVRGFSSLISSFGLQRYKSNITKAVNGYNYVLQSLYAPEQLAEPEKKKTEKLKESARKAKELAKSKLPRPVKTPQGNN